MSWNARHDGSGKFYIRRFFRIAPMFYAALAFFLWLRGFAPNMYAPDGLGLRHVFMTATFTHGFMPDTITSVVPGSWSIADEMMFYAIFPLLITSLNKVRFPIAALLIGLVTFALSSVQLEVVNTVLQMADPGRRALMGIFTQLWFVQQLPCFLFGMLVYKWASQGAPMRLLWARCLIIASLAGMVFLACFPHPSLFRLSQPMQYGALFALFALGLMRWQPRLLVNPIIGWIGKVSFSGYLIHLTLIATAPIPHASYLEAFLALTAATIALSTITFFCVEEPGNRLGRLVVKALSTVQERDAQARSAVVAT
jgi:peptidoglycan/LPS O-acetylase OafA/YrhL